VNVEVGDCRGGRVENDLRFWGRRRWGRTWDEGWRMGRKRDGGVRSGIVDSYGVSNREMEERGDGAIEPLDDSAKARGQCCSERSLDV
jgi:hypothetical protein